MMDEVDEWLSEMTDECLSEIAHSETTWGPDLNDSSSSLTDTFPSVPGRISPVAVQSEDSSSKQLITELKGSRNIQIYNVQIADSKGDKELLSGKPDHYITAAGRPVNQDQGKGKRKVKRTTTRLSSMKLEESCTNCEDQHSATIKHLILQQRYEDLQKQSDRENEECEHLKTRLNDNQETTNLLKDLSKAREVITLQEKAEMQSKISSLEVDKSSLEKEMAADKQQFKNEELKLHREQEEERNAFQERFHTLNRAINSQAEKIAAHEQQAEEQKNAFEQFRIKFRNQRKINDGLNNEIDDLQQQLVTERMQSDNLRTDNDALQQLVNTLDTLLQAFEGQDVLHNELRQIIDVLRPPQLPPQLPPEQVVITALRVKAASDHDPH